jgi:tetratricopeptide (TPR) repeat protein
MAGASPQEYIVEIPVVDLQTEVRKAVEDWRTSANATPDGLNELARAWFAGFGPGLSAAIAPGSKAAGDTLRVTLTIPPGADQARAARANKQGLGHAQAGRLDRALELFREAVERWPFDADYHRARGQAALELGEVQEAEDAFLAGLRLHPRDWASLTMLGNVRYAKGALQLARSLHEQSLAIHESAYALTNLGGVLGKEGQVSAARALFERALQLDPSYEKARIGLSVCKSYEHRKG